MSFKKKSIPNQMGYYKGKKLLKPNRTKYGSLKIW